MYFNETNTFAKLLLTKESDAIHMHLRRKMARMCKEVQGHVKDWVLTREDMRGKYFWPGKV